MAAAALGGVIGQLANPTNTAWFARLGSALTSADVGAAQAYLRVLGYAADTPICPGTDWYHAERIIRDPEWDAAWWDREATERTRLLDAMERQLGEVLAMERLSAATEFASEAIHAAAAGAAERDGLDDTAMIKAAAGAASLVLHGAALVRLTGAGADHLFMRKYALFEAGRWPLGCVRGAFYLF